MKGKWDNKVSLAQKKKGLVSKGLKDGVKNVRDVDLGVSSGNAEISAAIGDNSQSRRAQ